MAKQLVSPEGAKFLQAVARKPGQPSGEVYHAVGIYPEIGIHIQKELEGQGLIEVQKVRTEKQQAARRGNFRNILYPTAEGLQLLKEIEVEIEEKPPQKIRLGKVIGGKPGCRHHWIIETANGPISRGECEVCNGTSYFQNFLSRDPTEHP